MNYGNYMDDCIHLHACRRMAKIWRESAKPKSTGANFVARGCNETCAAYLRMCDVVPTEFAIRCVRSLARNIAYGHSEDDELVLCENAIFAESERIRKAVEK